MVIGDAQLTQTLDLGRTREHIVKVRKSSYLIADTSVYYQVGQREINLGFACKILDNPHILW